MEGCFKSISIITTVIQVMKSASFVESYELRVQAYVTNQGQWQPELFLKFKKLALGCMCANYKSHWGSLPTENEQHMLCLRVHVCMKKIRVVSLAHL